MNHSVIDLGHQPPSNAYIKLEKESEPEITYPLQVYLCESCWLMQIPAHASAEELFTPEYAYLSSTSTSWCRHAEEFVEKAIQRLKLDEKSLVVEIASNDGYLLQFVKEKGIPCLGIEPTHAAASLARKRGVHTMECFFGNNMAEELECADLVIANNVLAHVPDINDFMAGISKLLKDNGLASIEFPHLLRLIEKNQFDTIYHEHYSYLSLSIVSKIALCVGLEVFDVEELKTHGGSLRVWLSKKGTTKKTKIVYDVLDAEKHAGLESIQPYKDFQARAIEIKHSLIEYLLSAKRAHRRVLGYGAAAKGNTLLNYAGINSDLLEAVADKAPSKQGKLLPGSHIKVITPKQLSSEKFDSLLIFPWNLIDELKLEFPNTELVTMIPELKIHNE